jgi:hypothetical protein
MPRNFWEPGAKRKAFHKEMGRRNSAPDKPLTVVAAKKLVGTFKKKAVSRLKTFYAESQRMDTKVTEMLEKAESLGFIIDSFAMNSVDEEYVLNYRKRTKGLVFQVIGHRDYYQFDGKLTITPASMLLRLNCPKLKTIYTKSGYALSHLQINYYRTMNISDNYLAALVGGGTVEVETAEVPF